MLEIDQSVLDALPYQEKQKLTRQLRQQQITRYNEWIKQESSHGNSPNEVSQDEVLKRNVGFGIGDTVWDAVNRNDDTEVLKLLELGGDPNTANCFGVTLLHKCCIENFIGLAKLLVSHKADVNAKDDDNWTALHYAAVYDRSDIITLLLENGANPSALDIDSNFPIDHTDDGSSSQKILLDYQAKSDFDAGTLKTLRYNIARQMTQDIIALKETATPLDLQNEDGVNLLHIASCNGYTKVVQLLLKSGVDVNSADNEGWTALHMASCFGQHHIVRMLINQGAYVNVLTLSGKLPVDVAHNPGIVNTLTKASTDTEYIMASDLMHNAPDRCQDEDVYVSQVQTKTINPFGSSITKEDILQEATIRRNSLEGDSSHKDTSDGSKLACFGDEDEDVYGHLDFTSRSSMDEGTASSTELPQTYPNDDLAKLPEISEQVLLTILEERYNANMIYTNIGDILLSVNPFCTLPYYSKAASVQYHVETKAFCLPPHIYATSEHALRSLGTEHRSQCIIISGESGAGKTEASKYAVDHILYNTVSQEVLLNKRIQQVNPLLEAFGNAQTEMNSNSSRFGKYFELVFSRDGYVIGAKLNEYLLESSRVVHHGANETNYHVFYLMFAGMEGSERSPYHLLNPENYRYLHPGGLKNIKSQHMGPENKIKFMELKSCLGFVGFTPQDIEWLFRTLSGILLLGNLTFEAAGEDGVASLINGEIVDQICDLFSIDIEDFMKALVSETILTDWGDTINKVRTPEQANYCRDALSRTFYRRLFSWIVNGINKCIRPDNTDEEDVLSIGILDIFGFEDFNRNGNKNSFEQLCINITNERLQTYFNKHIFSMEKEEAAKDGINLGNVSYENNQMIIDMFINPTTGLLALIDEQSRLANATDKVLANVLHENTGRRIMTSDVTWKK